MNNKIIVIPTYNEVDSIKELIAKIYSIYPDTDILVADDNSPDGTGRLVDELALKNGRIRCLHRPRKDGIGMAYIDSFKKVLGEGYDYILQMDADFSHDPRYIPQLFEEAVVSDLVIGSRYVKGGGVENWGILRRFMSIFGSLYSRLILGIPISDLTGGFKCFNRKVLESIGLDEIKSRGYAFQIETTLRAYKKGFIIKEIPIIFPDRRKGRTKMSADIFLEAVINVWKFKSIDKS